MGLRDLLDRFEAKRKGIPVELVTILRTGNYDSPRFLFRNEDGNYVTLHGEVIKAKSVGDVKQVFHLTYHDMMENEVRRDVTKLRIVDGLKIDAVYIDREKGQREGDEALTTYQPLRILH